MANSMDNNLAVFCDFENVALGVREKDGERLDFGKAATPIRGNQDLEAVGTKHRTTNTGGQSKGCPELIQRR